MPEHMSVSAVEWEVNVARDEGQPIDDAVARTIASWFSGDVFRAVASGEAFDRDELVRVAERMAREAAVQCSDDRDVLVALIDWAQAQS